MQMAFRYESVALAETMIGVTSSHQNRSLAKRERDGWLGVVARYLHVQGFLRKLSANHGQPHKNNALISGRSLLDIRGPTFSSHPPRP